MLHPRLLAALLLAAPLAATAQTKPATTLPAPTAPAPTTAAPQQVTEVTEELDPATGKVIRRTTRTTTAPAGTAAPAAPRPATSAAPAAVAPADTQATDAQVTVFLRQKTAVAALTAPALLTAYGRFMDRVRNDRHTWKASDWATAAAVLSRLNTRYDQLRTTLSLDDKLTIRSEQAEFQALRTARQLSDQVSDKL